MRPKPEYGLQSQNNDLCLYLVIILMTIAGLESIIDSGMLTSVFSPFGDITQVQLPPDPQNRNLIAF
jgi:hypothetical protein